MRCLLRIDPVQGKRRASGGAVYRTIRTRKKAPEIWDPHLVIYRYPRQGAVIAVY